MSKRCRKVKDSDGRESVDTLFIRTSLGTRLVTTIHNSATVANAKRKIELEHSQVIPAMGEIKIHTLQVEHQGDFYCLTDSMPLSSAYVGQGSSRSRSLFIEATSSEHDEKVGIVGPEVNNNQEELPPGNATSLPDKDEVANEARNQSVLPDHLDPVAKPDDGSQHVALALQNDHHAGTDEELAASPSNAEAGSKETSISHGTKNKKGTKKEVVGIQISSVGEQSKCTGADSSIAMKVAADDTVNADKNDSAVPQIENDGSNIVEMDRSVSADLLVQSEVTGGAGSISPKRKKRKVEKSGCRTEKTKTKKSTTVDQNYSVREQAATDDGLSSAPFEEVTNEDTGPQIMLTQDAVKPMSKSEVLWVLGVHPDHKNTEEMDGIAREVVETANEKLVAGKPEDVQGQVLDQLSKHQEDDNMKEKKEKKKTKKKKSSCSSAAEDISTSGMEEQSHGAEGLVASLTSIQEVGNETSQFMDVSVSVAPGDGAEALQMQEVLLPLVGVHPDHENTGEMDGNARDEVENANETANEKLVAGQLEDVQGQVLDQLAKHQEDDNMKKKKEKKKKKKKKSRSSAAEDISTSGMKEQSHGAEGSVASLTSIQEVGNETSQFMDVSVSVTPGDGAEALQMQEVLLPLVGVHPDYENTGEMDGNARDEVENANEKLVTGQLEDVQGQVLDQLGKHQENDISGNMKEKKKKKRSRGSAAEDISTSGMKEPSHGAEGSVAPLTSIQEVGNETSQFMDVSVSVAPGEGEEALQLQEVFLPLVGVHPDHENTGEMDGNAREEEVESANEKPVFEQPNVEDPALDQLGRHQENGSSLMKEKKKKKRPSETTGRRKPSSKGERAVHSTDTSFQNEKEDLGTTSAEVPLQNRPETEINDVSKGADEKIDFLTYFTPGQSQSEIESSVKVKGTSKSTKEKKMKDQKNDAGGTILEKGRKPTTASRNMGTRAASLTAKSNGPEETVQNTKIAKQHQAFNRNATSTGKGSSGRSLLKSSGKEKSLFNKERKLFSDSESESSSDENKTTNSDASTQPPSRNSSSSDSSSDEESDASQDSKQKETKGTGDGAAGPSVSSKKKLLPGIGEMSMDAIIKSSKRFKKAKFTASQSQEPDRQAN